MHLFLSVILFTLLGTLSASPVRLRTRGGHGSAIAGQESGPSEETLKKMGDFEYSWTKYNPQKVATLEHVYELDNFGKSESVTQKKVLVRIHQGDCETFLDIQRQQFQKLGVLRAWGCIMSEPKAVHYIVIEKKGEFCQKAQMDLLSTAQKTYKSEYNMNLRIDGVFYQRYTVENGVAYPVFGAIDKYPAELPDKAKEGQEVELAKVQPGFKVCGNWVGKAPKF